MAGDVIQELRRLGAGAGGGGSRRRRPLFGEVRLRHDQPCATIAGGTALNVIPDRCALEIGIRLLPGMTGADMSERVRRAVERAVGPDAYAFEPINESPAHGHPRCGADPRHAVRARGPGRLARSGVHHRRRLARQAGIWIASSSGRDPFRPRTSPNEWLPVAEFERAAGLLESVVERLCVRRRVSP